MSMNVRVGGAWKDISAVSVRVGGAWKTVSQAYVKVSGTWKELLGGGIVLTQKGYGYAGTGASDTATLTLNYSNVQGGSAPAAGDLVIWNVIALDTGGNPFSSPSGWSRSVINSGEYFYLGALAKIVASGDISSPPNIVTGPQFGAAGYWIAYTISGGSPTTATVTGHDANLGGGGNGAGAPSNTLIDAGGVAGPLVSTSMGTGTDGSIQNTWSGATEDQSASIASQFVGATGDLASKWKKYDEGETGDDITVSKGDDGNYNNISSFYVTLS